MRVTVNGIGVHYQVHSQTTDPSVPVVTLSHSLATNLSMWDPQLPALGARYRLLRYDTRGHGGTDVAPGPYTLEMLARDAFEVLSALEVERTHFVGLSMGGMIGQLLALTHPEKVRSLVLCDTSSRVPPEARSTWDERIRMAETHGMEPHVEPTLGRWFTAPFHERRPDVLDRVRAMIRATDPKGYTGCCHAIKMLDLTDRLTEIKVPTLILVGEEDPGTPVAASRAIHERIKGSRLVVIPSASHLSNIEQPDAFNEALTAFLEEH
jgi:3-oxoadipate enol-lactonase